MMVTASPAMRTPSLLPSAFSSQAGIAIGPILFVIAILAVLAAAIAAGSGSFSGDTNQQKYKTLASSIISTGDTLKAGMEKLLLGGNATDSNYYAAPNSTNNATDLFSPAGGGVNISPSINIDGTNYYWIFPVVQLPGWPASGNEQIAMLDRDIPQALCSELQRQITGSATIPSFTGSDPLYNSSWTIADMTGSGIPNGTMIGCFERADIPGTYIFFQLLAGNLNASYQISKPCDYPPQSAALSYCNN